MSSEQVSLNIPVTHFQPLLSWDQRMIERLTQSAIDLAVTVGVRLDDDHEGVFLKEAASKGAKANWNTRAVEFTQTDIEETVAVLQRSQPAAQPLRERIVCPSRHEKFLAGNGANLFFDYDAWQAKRGTQADLVELSQWAQGCEDVDSLLAPVLLQDVDRRLEPIVNFALRSKYFHKKVYVDQPVEPIQVKYLPRMQEIVSQRRGYPSYRLAPWEFMNSPFRIGLRAVETMLARVDSGACDVMGIGSMTISGMSAPVTIPGVAVQMMAEVLAGLTLVRILRPGFGLLAEVGSGTLDLRSGNVRFSGIRCNLQNLAAKDLFVRGLGVDPNCLTHYREANEPGMQALYEFGMAQAFFSCVLNRCYPEIGGLACGSIFSPEQAVLDIQSIKEFNELAHGFPASEEELGLEDIVACGFDNSYHMSSEHTLAHMTDAVTFSDYLYRGLPAGAHHNKDKNQTDELMEKAAELVKTAKAKGRKVDPDTELANELYEFVKQAAAELGVEAPVLL